MRKASSLLILPLVLFFLKTQAQHQDPLGFINEQHVWVDSVFNRLSQKEKVAQLFLVRAHTNLGQKYIDSVAQVIKKEKLGGAVLFQGGPVRHAHMINQYQEEAEVPLMLALDGEWGLGMRLPDSTVSYPYQMALGAVQDEQLLYQMGLEVAMDFRRLGLQVNFAPDVDVNNNPNNPVINFRSFGEDKHNVYRKALQYMRGMTDGHIFTTLKHFPGHGDTDVDSHYDLPKLNFDRARLDSIEMDPFRRLINDGAPGVMVGHMSIPSLDNEEKLPSSLSRPIITGILKEELGFKGLTFTDAMDMRGVTRYFTDGEADVRAILAGNDVLEISENTKVAIRKVRRAVRKKRISQEELDAKVKKILAAKYWLGVHSRQKVEINGLYEDLNRPEAFRLRDKLAEASVTLLKGGDLIKRLDPSRSTALVSIGQDSISTFQDALKTTYDKATIFVLGAKSSPAEIEQVRKELEGFEQVIVALHDPRLRPASKLPYQSDIRLFVSELSTESTVLCLFGNPYSLASFPGIERAGAISVHYQNDAYIQKAGARLLTHELLPNGKLPVGINVFFRYGDGLDLH